MTIPQNAADSFTISVTERAATQVLRIINENSLPDGSGLRAGVVEGGCSGFNYQVDIVETPNPTDLVLERHGARVFVDQESMHAINGMTIDWVSSMQESRFIFDNPNATGTCGCGVSFSVDDH